MKKKEELKKESSFLKSLKQRIYEDGVESHTIVYTWGGLRKANPPCITTGYLVTLDKKAALSKVSGAKEDVLWFILEANPALILEGTGTYLRIHRIDTISTEPYIEVNVGIQ